MAKVYADLIRKGLKTIDDVPEKIKANVEKLVAVDSSISQLIETR